MIVQVLSSAISGINAIPVRIEMHVSKGIRYSLVGLPDNAVKESHERIIFTSNRKNYCPSLH